MYVVSTHYKYPSHKYRIHRIYHTEQHITFETNLFLPFKGTYFQLLLHPTDHTYLHPHDVDMTLVR